MMYSSPSFAGGQAPDPATQTKAPVAQPDEDTIAIMRTESTDERSEDRPQANLSSPYTGKLLA